MNNNFLILDTTYDSSFAVVYANGQVFFSRSDTEKGKTSERVIPFIEDSLKMANITKNDLKYIFAVVGPGSFTGIRIGVSIVSAISYGLNIKKASLTVFDGLGKMQDYKMIPSRRDYFYYSYNDQMGEVSVNDLPDIKILSKYTDVGNTVPDDVYAQKLSLKALTLIQNGFNEDVLTPLYLKKSQAERLKEGK